MGFRRLLSQLNCLHDKTDDENNEAPKELPRGEESELEIARRLERTKARELAQWEAIYGGDKPPQLRQDDATSPSQTEPSRHLPEANLKRTSPSSSKYASSNGTLENVDQVVEVVDSSTYREQTEQVDDKKRLSEAIRELTYDEIHKKSLSLGTTSTSSTPDLVTEGATDDWSQSSLEQHLEDVLHHQKPSSGRSTRGNSLLLLPSMSAEVGSLRAANAHVEDEGSICNSSIAPVLDDYADPERVAMLKQAMSPWQSRTDLLENANDCGTGNVSVAAGQEVAQGSLIPEQDQEDKVVLGNDQGQSNQQTGSYLDATMQVSEREVGDHLREDLSTVGTPVQTDRPLSKAPSMKQLLSDRSRTSSIVCQTTDWVDLLHEADKPGPDADPLERPGSPGVHVQVILPEVFRPVIKPSIKKNASSKGRNQKNSQSEGANVSTAKQPPKPIQTNQRVSSARINPASAEAKARRASAALPLVDTTLLGQRDAVLTSRHLTSRPIPAVPARRYSENFVNGGPISPLSANPINKTPSTRQKAQKEVVDPDDIPLSHRRSLLKARRASYSATSQPQASGSPISPISPNANTLLRSDNNKTPILSYNPASPRNLITTPSFTSTRMPTNQEKQFEAQRAARQKWLHHDWRQSLATASNTSTSQPPTLHVRREAMLADKRAEFEYAERVKTQAVERQIMMEKAIAEKRAESERAEWMRIQAVEKQAMMETLFAQQRVEAEKAERRKSRAIEKEMRASAARAERRAAAGAATDRTAGWEAKVPWERHVMEDEASRQVVHAEPLMEDLHRSELRKMQRRAYQGIQ